MSCLLSPPALTPPSLFLNTKVEDYGPFFLSPMTPSPNTAGNKLGLLSPNAAGKRPIREIEPLTAIEYDGPTIESILDEAAKAAAHMNRNNEKDSPVAATSPQEIERNSAFIVAESMSRAAEEALLHPPIAFMAEAAILLHRLRNDPGVCERKELGPEAKAPLVYLLNSDLRLDNKNTSGYSDCFAWTEGTGVWYLKGTKESHKIQADIWREFPSIAYHEVLEKAGAKYYRHYNEHPATRAAMVLARERTVRNAAVQACAKLPPAATRVWRGAQHPNDRYLFTNELGLLYVRDATPLYDHLAKKYPEIIDESKLENNMQSPDFSPGLNRTFPALTDLANTRRDYESARRRRRAERVETAPTPITTVSRVEKAAADNTEVTASPTKIAGFMATHVHLQQNSRRANSPTRGENRKRSQSVPKPTVRFDLSQAEDLPKSPSSTKKDYWALAKKELLQQRSGSPQSSSKRAPESPRSEPTTSPRRKRNHDPIIFIESPGHVEDGNPRRGSGRAFSPRPSRIPTPIVVKVEKPEPASSSNDADEALIGDDNNQGNVSTNEEETPKPHEEEAIADLNQS